MMFQRSVFWKDASQEYSDLTHLHGFKEFNLSSSKIEKILWSLIILLAFALTCFLIFKSIEDSLDDNKRTFVDYKKYGIISLPLLYCPTDWIDMKKIVQANISENYILYALSYLRTYEISYRIKNVFLTKDKFCDQNFFDEQIIPDLDFFAPFIETKCLDYDKIPNYYGPISRQLIDSYKKITMVVDMSNKELIKIIFNSCQRNEYDKVWRTLYFHFFLSLSIMDDDGKNQALFGLNEKMTKCGTSEHAILLSLHDIDNVNDARCAALSEIESKYEVDVDDHGTDICGMYNDALIFYMFHEETIRNYLAITGSSAYINIETRHAKLILQFISQDKNYSRYLKQNDEEPSYESFKKFLNTEIGGSNVHQNVELLKIQKHAEEEFKKDERIDFHRFLNDHNFTVFDVFKLISFDGNKFLLGMSVDRLDELRPRQGNITVEKVVNSLGVCYLFQIEADMNPITEFPISFNHINRRRKLNEKLYVNLVELNIQTYSNMSSFVRPGNSILVIGNDAHSLIPSQTSIEIESDHDKPSTHFHSIEVSNLAYRTSPDKKCQKNWENHNNNTYTYSNCLINCFNNYSQSKSIDGSLQHKINCRYITESMDIVNINDQCSFFTEIFDERQSNQSKIVEELSKCNTECLEDCTSTTFDIKSNKSKCLLTRQSHNCRATYSALNVEKFVYQKSLLFDYYLHLANNSDSGPIWMKEHDKDDFGVPTIYDMVKGIEDVYAPRIVRIEIQINSDVTTYVTRESLEWYSYLGVVGGQINLVISGSLLTLFQLLWWWSQYFYHHHCRMPTSRGLRKAEMAVMLSQQEEANVKCIKYSKKKKFHNSI